MINERITRNPPQPPMRGLGDAVARLAEPIARELDRRLGTHIVGCGGCKKRREALNRAVPFVNPQSGLPQG